MKTLLLLRHAKSSWADDTLDDFDRPLALRGMKAAPRMGRELTWRDWLPDAALVSPARRTVQSWNLVAAELPETPQVEFCKELYEASAEQVLDELRKTAGAIRTLLVLGHNPGLGDLAKQLAAPASDALALKQLDEKFPTAALARLVFDAGWADLRLGTARLTHCLRPKDLDQGP
ncbi:SixA phosphatase family protein [Kumtagia ephedrae]|uniref:Histidine phosphatase family protein n=1 Tax=Kumtagia ephedrae TaxID=2116701 RepID=A0A2P7SEZ7_9HYPH|nr:histidine phosphatase family protein [Mesorhizobium ephedrae]PSJ61053.1 histidine phosphatase family protein [Mesorhizobium ephedrae]